MNESVKVLIETAVRNILKKTSGDSMQAKLQKKHEQTVHFVPPVYRVFGGMLQSTNIQFGNFLEELMTLCIKNEPTYEIVEKYSGKKSNKFTLSKTNSALIDEYIETCQTQSNNLCDEHFRQLQTNILQDTDNNINTFKHDIDVLFYDKRADTYFYIEVKSNDDHDTGKFVDINRKFIKTYAYLANELAIKTIKGLTPILFYFNNKKTKENTYIPEPNNLLRGKAFFDQFLTKINYDELNSYMTEMSNSEDIKKLFDDLYHKVMEKCKK